VAALGVRYAREGIDFAHNGYLGFDVSTRFRTGLYGLTVAGAVMNMGSRSAFTGPGVGEAIRQPRYDGKPTGRNIPVQWDVREVEMPTTFNFALLSQIYGDAEAMFGANPNHALLAEVNFRDAIDTDIQPAIGVEYGFKKTFFARAGKKFLNEQHAPWGFGDGVAFGGGVRLPILGRHMTLDYAYTVMGELRNNQVISFDIGS
jgi:hypothetical protein